MERYTVLMDWTTQYYDINCFQSYLWSKCCLLKKNPNKLFLWKTEMLILKVILKSNNTETS